MISFAGGTAPSHSGLPNGGVASTWKVAISNGFESAERAGEPALASMANTRQQTLKRLNMADYRCGAEEGCSSNIGVGIIPERRTVDYRLPHHSKHVTSYPAHQSK